MITSSETPLPPPDQTRSPESAAVVLNRLEENVRKGDGMNPLQFLEDIYALDQTKATSKKEVRILLKSLGDYPPVWKSVVSFLEKDAVSFDASSLRKYLRVGQLLSFDQNPEIAYLFKSLGDYLAQLESPPELSEEVQSPERRILLQAVAASLVTAFFGTAAGRLKIGAQSTTSTTDTLLPQDSEISQPPVEEEVKLAASSKEQRILYPKELNDYNEVKKWIGKLRSSHESVLTESLFTKELAFMTVEQRNKVMTAIAKAHAKALVEHFGDVEAIIGLDPGHGGSEIGSTGTTADGTILQEKELTWTVVEMIAEEIYKESAGKYTAVILRPQIPVDLDLDGDGITSPVERIQKRKALLLDMESKLRPNPLDRGKNIVYLSVHLNGSIDPNQKGVEVYWPNQVGEPNNAYRESSMKLVQLLQKELPEAIKAAGYPVQDRGAKEDPDKRTPPADSKTQIGPYIALGSPRLDRVLKR